MRRLTSALGVVVALAVLAAILATATLVDRRPPTIGSVDLSATAGDEHIAQTITAIDIDFSEPVRTGGVERRFHVEPYVAGAFTWDGSTLIFTPSARLPEDTEFRVSVDAGFEDLAGNVAATGLEAWVFRTVGPPAVQAVQPADGTIGVAVDAGLELAFDRLMDTAAVESAITVDPTTAIRASWSGSKVRLAFPTGLAFGTTYTLTVGTGAADTAGNPLRSPYRTSFTTVAAGLAVIDTMPRDGVAGIDVRTPIALWFDAPIDPDGVAQALVITPRVTGSFEVIAPPTDEIVPPGTIPATLLVFRPDAPLPAHTTFSVALEPVIHRLRDASTVAAGRTWSFTTGASATTAQNQVVFASERSGVRQLWLMNPDGTNVRQLTSGLAPVSAYDVTLDGGHVAVSSAGIVELLTIDASAPRRLTDDAVFEYAPLFSPDDRWLLVGRRDRSGADLGYWLVPLPGNLEPERQVTTRGAPEPPSITPGEGASGGHTHPSNTHLAHSAFDASGRWLLLVDAKRRVTIIDLDPATDPAVAARPIDLVVESPAQWSGAAGAFVVIAPDGSAGSTVFLVRPDGSTEAVPGSADAWPPVAVGPDGRLAVVARVASGSVAVRVIESGGGAPDVGLAVAYDALWPVWSPDGASILLVRSLAGRPDLPAGLWRLDLASGTVDQLTTDGTWPRWLP